ncbi:MAG: type I-U CRISPR-associated protein Cas5/Cas6 [Phycisphaera sp. RhM]|nr:type I-U CRISPR-associated protein Cas5/Cas6 [Phycisphaera sp. RhM]
MSRHHSGWTSSSLVNVSANLVSDTSSLPSHNRSLDDRRMNPQGEHWRTTTDFRGVSLRVPTEGEFARLRFSGSREKIDAFVEWQERCTVGTTSEKRSAKRSFEEQFGIKFSKNMRPPEPIPATISTWQTYCRANEAVSDAVDSEPPTNCFDTDLVVLTHFDGPTLTLADTLSISKILRSSVMTHCGVQPPPPWVSGHDANSKPTKDPHLAFLPLAYTGSAYADGHLLGYALALPIGIPLNELRECLAPVLYSGESPSRLKLTLGILGEMTLLLEQRLEPPQALRVETWTLPSRRWESVTPVVLDRYPKTDRRKDLLGWRTEVAETICRSCEFVGVPRPTAIDIDTTAFQQGVPRATQKQVPGTSRRTRRGAGDGFRPLPTRQGKPARPQIHVRLQFESPVAGPILIGAGRFLGYGLLKPVIHHKRDGGS